ncbi:DNA-3-methyladenine glycosylase I [Chitinolyticbacter meiyuanensis]|uniref:DNA-3-methyladenine glycosylase I n=1 Tax=Chitinolyticbacter meiyuanensis TaxID=682798 RepID=UPI0011E5F8DC|nr:DNA-3-methyladenine glycosylase I [Chitinolyticbacter meiyuanensis]
MTTSPTRCAWCSTDPLYQAYHDQEWGVPCRDSQALFELLCLEGAQAGLSWITVLKKRARYREVFDGFDPQRMAGYGDDKVAALLLDPGIVRNRAKVAAFIGNARAWLALRDDGIDFAQWIWGFVDHAPQLSHPTTLADVPARTATSDAMSKALQARGFKFVGSTICYAFMQAAGLVNDHTRDCWCAPAPA